MPTVNPFKEYKIEKKKDCYEVHLPSDELLEGMKHFKYQAQFILLLDICGIDKEGEGSSTKGQQVIYHLLNLEQHSRLRVVVDVNDEKILDSVTSVWKCAGWFEQEAHDLVGISFKGIKQRHFLTTPGLKGYPLRKGFKLTERQPLVEKEKGPANRGHNIAGEPDPYQYYEMGPFHPLLNGAMKINCQIKNDIISELGIEIGYLHRGFEKIAESRTYSELLPFTGHLNMQSAPINNLAWCRSVEEASEIEIPDRAKAIRMVFCELARIADHLACLGRLAQFLGAQLSYQLIEEQREKVLQLFYKSTGSRNGLNAIVIGGVAYDVNSMWISECLDFLPSLKKSLDKIHQVLARSRVWRERNEVGQISGRDAIDWGYTGVCLRSTGINYDTRKTNPFYFYSSVDFDVPLGLSGSCFDRYLVRAEEIRQSLKIISQLLEYIPAGEILLQEWKMDQAQEKSSKISYPEGHYYSYLESPNGELGHFLVGTGESRPYRLKLRSSSFSLLQSLPELSRGVRTSDLLVILTSLNISSGELNR